VYICSAGHSGSTLLDLLLGSHSKVESLGEISHLPKNITLNTKCSCGEAVRDCNVWSAVLNNLGHQLEADLGQTPYRLNTGYPKATTVVDRNRQTKMYLIRRKLVHGLIYLDQRYGISLLSSFTRWFTESLKHRFMLYDAVRESTGTDIVIDSSKTYLEGIALYRECPEHVRIIVLTRDGRGVMYSNMKREQGRKNGLIGWVHYYSRILPLLKKHVAKDHSLTVHYEDLANNTKNELAKICRFIGVDFEPSMQEFTSHEHHITNGNDMRFSESSEIRLDTSWKENLTKEDLDYFENEAGNLSRKLGYE